MKTAFDLIIQFVIRAIIAANSYQIFSNTQNIKIGIPARVRGARRYNYSSFFKRISSSITGRYDVMNACNSGEE